MRRLDTTNRWSVDHLVYGADAALLLEQAAGRLIRSTGDDGVVAVLDPRLLRAGQSVFQYGAAARKLYLGALEAFTSRTTRIEQAVDRLKGPLRRTVAA